MKLTRANILIVILAMLCGCSPTVDEDVVKFVKKQKSQKSNYVSNIPKIPVVKPFQYSAFDLRDPFVPYSVATAEKGAGVFQGGPDLNRPREVLEAFPLDSLKMVGTIERDGIFFALMKNPTGTLYRVSVGNYIGQNSGQIEKISATEVAIKEWLSNGKGGWREHLVTIRLYIKSSKAKGD